MAEAEPEPAERCSRCDLSWWPEDFHMEASDLAGALICVECADEVIEENDQFGVGA